MTIHLRLPALQIRQGARAIYAFAVDGKRLHEFATVSRVHRDDDDALRGYQRPEVASHIRAIRRYLESDDAMLPNAIVLAFDERVRFVPAKRAAVVEYACAGELVIPIDPSLPDESKPAWLVDGQQRSAAIRDADLDSFPMAAVGFIAAAESEQRSQFILVNNTKPLPKGLIHELLPEASGHLPPRFERRRLPAYVMSRLNTDPDSPFRGLIATPTSPAGYIKDNSILKMIECSLYEGALYQYRNPVDGSGDHEAMLNHLKVFWTLVQQTWPLAWSLPPRKSRLTHGVGIQALGYVMDAMTEGIPASVLEDLAIDKALITLNPVVAWTDGVWSGIEDGRRWNSLQNTPRDIRLVTNLLLESLGDPASAT